MTTAKIKRPEPQPEEEVDNRSWPDFVQVHGDFFMLPFYRSRARATRSPANRPNRLQPAALQKKSHGRSLLENWSLSAGHH